MNKILRVFAVGLILCGLLVTMPSETSYAAGDIASGGMGNGNTNGKGGIHAMGYFVTIYEEANDYLSNGTADQQEQGKTVNQMKKQWSKYFVEEDWTTNPERCADRMVRGEGFIVCDNQYVKQVCNNGNRYVIENGNAKKMSTWVHYIDKNHIASTPQIDSGQLDPTMSATDKPQEAYQHTGGYQNSAFDKELLNVIMDNAHTSAKLNGYIAAGQEGMAWRQYMQLLYSVYVNSKYNAEMAEYIESYLRNTNRNGSQSFQVITITAVVAMPHQGGYAWYTAPEFYGKLLGVKKGLPNAETVKFKSKANWANSTTSWSQEYMKSDAQGWSNEIRSGVKGRIKYDTSYANSQTIWQPAWFSADGSVKFSGGYNQARWRYTVFPTGYYGKDGGNSGYTFIASKVEEGPLAASYGLYLQTTPKNKPFDTTMGGSTEATSKITFPSNAGQILQS